MAHTLSPEDYRTLGVSFYKSKQYDKAIEAFTHGINASIVPAATLLDYRAAVYEKLENFELAAKDGYNMIRAHKKDVKGYLRVGSTFQKQNKLDRALRIYNYGLQNVPITHEDFKLLQRKRDRLTRMLSPPNALDPLVELPKELMDLIVHYLPFKTQVNCLRVSKSWQVYLSKECKFWTHIDLSDASKTVSSSFLTKAVRYSQNKLHTLTLHRAPHLPFLRNVGRVCKSLHTINIISFPHTLSDTLVSAVQFAQNLRKLLIIPCVTADAVIQILRRRPELESLEIKSVLFTRNGTGRSLPRYWQGGPFHSLHTLAMNGVEPNGQFDFGLLTLAPALQSLTVIKIPSSILKSDQLFHSKLTSLVLKKVGAHEFPLLPPTLKSLSLHSVVLLTWNNVLRSRLPELTYLDLSEVCLSPEFLEYLLDLYEDDDGTQHALSDAKPLQHLSLSGTLDSPFDEKNSTVTAHLLKSKRILTPSLMSLRVPFLPFRDDDARALIASDATNLSSINLSSTKISGAGLKTLVDGMPRLEVARLDHCRNLSSRDAIEYAQSRGVHVHYTMNEHIGLANGRSVRY